MDHNAETLYSCEEHEEEEADETLSLSSAFPLHDSTNSLSDHSSDEEADLFEFLIDEHLINTSGDIMCSADDIIINGKLLPSNLLLQTPLQEIKLKNPVTVSDSPAKQEQPKTAESPGRFDKAAMAAVDAQRKKNAAVRPRWQLLGVSKFPTEMELRDIRTRQLRRKQQAAATSAPGRSHVGRRQCGLSIGSWKVFNSLSCKKGDGAGAVVANASFPPTKGTRYVH